MKIYNTTGEKIYSSKHKSLIDTFLSAYDKKISFFNANLRGINLCGANLRGINLCGADLIDANLVSANLIGANLHNANLYNTNLYNANFYNTNLHNANFYRANLCGANLNCSKPPVNEHNFISMVLFNHAKTIDQRKLAGLIQISLDWCWNDFFENLSKEEIEWAKNILCTKWKEFENKFK